MSKKIFDIKPPKTIIQTISQSEKEIEDILKEEDSENDLNEYKPKEYNKKPVPISRRPDKEQKKSPQRRKKNDNFLLKALAVAGIFLAILIVYLFFKLPKAEVDIWPKTEDLSFKETITADKSVDLVDLNNKSIPAEYLQDEMDYTQEFLATGNASNEGKSGGIVTIYNKCDFLKPVILKVGTHFISDSNKYFKILSKATIPAGVKSGGKIIPGSVDVMVEAAEGGESYNIKPANFSVPKFVGTVYYYCIYAQSKEQMSGGFAGAVKKVTEDDIQSAKDALADKLSADIESSLKSKISSDYILIDNAISSQILSGSSDTKAGVIIDKFNYSAKARVSSLVFKGSDLDKFAKDYIISKIPESKNLLEESFNITYTTEVVDIEGGKITLNIEFSAKIYPDIDKNSLTYLLRRKTGEQINETINSSLGDKVSKVKVNFWPFWVMKSPKNQKAIDVELKFE